MLIGPNWSHLEPIRRILTHQPHLDIYSVDHYVTVRRFHTLMSVGRKKLVSLSKDVAAFRAVVKWYFECDKQYQNDEEQG